MSIKYSPMANHPYSSSFAVTASIAESNLGVVVLETASYAEVAQVSLSPLEQGPPGKDLVVEATLIEL